MRLMRSVLSAVAGLVALIALVAALPLGWVATHVASEDGYVSFSSGLIDDPDFRDEALAVVADDLVQRSVTDEALVPVVRTALAQASTAIVQQPDFEAAFEQTQRQSHRAVFGDARDLDPDLDASTALVIDLAPLAQVVLDAITENVPVDLQAPDQLLVTLSGSGQQRVIDAVDRTPSQGGQAAIVAALAAAVCLLAARRRSTALAWLGLGAAAVAGAVHLIAGRVVDDTIGGSTLSTGFARRAQQLLADRALESLDGWLVIAAIAGAAAVVVGLIARSISGSRA